MFCQCLKLEKQMQNEASKDDIKQLILALTKKNKEEAKKIENIKESNQIIEEEKSDSSIFFTG